MSKSFIPRLIIKFRARKTNNQVGDTVCKLAGHRFFLFTSLFVYLVEKFLFTFCSSFIESSFFFTVKIILGCEIMHHCRSTKLNLKFSRDIFVNDFSLYTIAMRRDDVLDAQRSSKFSNLSQFNKSCKASSSQCLFNMPADFRKRRKKS